MRTLSLSVQQQPFHPIMVLTAFLLCAGAAQAAGPTGLLNDTGQTQCDNGANSAVDCGEINSTTPNMPPGQDGHVGRDAVKPTKKGGGDAGFDLTKVCMDGSLDCKTAADTGANPAATAWACTKDNLTNLIWSLETKQGAKSSLTNTSRCGFNTGWRLPTRRELLGIVHSGKSFPSIDKEYFPNTSSNAYWTSETNVFDGSNSWAVSFDYGAVTYLNSTTELYMRLVHDGE